MAERRVHSVPPRVWPAGWAMRVRASFRPSVGQKPLAALLVFSARHTFEMNRGAPPDRLDAAKGFADLAIGHPPALSKPARLGDALAWHNLETGVLLGAARTGPFRHGQTTEFFGGRRSINGNGWRKTKTVDE
jgi:hypothetical protein